MDYYESLQNRYSNIKNSLPSEAQSLIEELLKDYVSAMDIIFKLDDALIETSEKIKQAQAILADTKKL